MSFTHLRFRLLEFLSLQGASALAALSPRMLARCGAALGLLLCLSPTMRRRIARHLAYAGLTDKLPLSTVCAHIGQMAVETLAMWRMPVARAIAQMQVVRGWDQVLQDQAARPAGQRGIIILSPHIGNFELGSLWIGAQRPMTVMFRAPKKAWVEQLMRQGRDRAQIHSVPTNLVGIRSLLKTLHQDGMIAILPDQMPTHGEGVWARFFGQPAYTMTLVHKLAQRTGAQLVMTCCTRRAPGEGYAFDFTPLPPLPPDPVAAAQALNTALEQAILRTPEQYLWSYNRFKGEAPITDIT